MQWDVQKVSRTVIKIDIELERVIFSDKVLKQLYRKKKDEHIKNVSMQMHTLYDKIVT